MLSNLEIKNFRAFSHLVIQRLGRVNLVVGKNNVGKTTLLEALRLYGSIWPRSTVSSILQERNELAVSPEGKPLLMLRTLFHGRGAEKGDEIVIHQSQDAECRSGFRATARFEAEPQGLLKKREHLYLHSAATISLDVKWPGRSFTLYADGNAAYEMASTSPKVPDFWPDPPCLRSAGAQTVTESIIAEWWDPLSLTDAERRVLESLQVIAPIRGISFVGDARGAGRTARARVEGIREPVSLASLGDGVVRLFQIAIALEYAAFRGGNVMQADATVENVFPLLLIDEVEVGIHHTLHAQLWRVIFHASRLLDVQVVATTHSLDCLRGFAAALAESEENDGLVIRLEKVEGEEQTGAVIIDREDLPIVVRDSIEVR